MAEFTFDELSPQAQKRALEECRRLFDIGSIISASKETVTQYLEEQLKKRHLPADSVQFKIEYDSITRLRFQGRADALKIARKILPASEYRLFRAVDNFLQVSVYIEHHPPYSGLDVRIGVRGDVSNLDHHSDMRGVLQKFSTKARTYVQSAVREITDEATEYLWGSLDVEIKLTQLVRKSALVFDERGSLSWNWV